MGSEPKSGGEGTTGTVLVTGAARRLGAAMALELAREGWDIVLHYRSSKDEAQALAEDLRGLGRRAWTICADLSDPRECAGLIGRTLELAGPVHALVNNASVFAGSTFMEFEPGALLDNVQLHAIAPALLARDLARQEEARHVLNMLDSKITGPDDEHLAYHLSKRMLASLTSIMARELAPKVVVNGIAPGAVLPALGDDPANFAALAEGVPMQKTGTPEDVARAAAFILGSRFITGQVLFVDGGRHLRGELYG